MDAAIPFESMEFLISSVESYPFIIAWGELEPTLEKVTFLYEETNTIGVAFKEEDLYQRLCLWCLASLCMPLGHGISMGARRGKSGMMLEAL